MVRLKTRWLLVRLDTAESIAMESSHRTASPPLHHSSSPLSSSFPFSKKDLYTALQQHLGSTFGVLGGTIDLQVRFWEPSIRILLLRVSREDCTRVRAALTVWTQLERIVTTMEAAAAMTTTTDRNRKKSNQPPPPAKRKFIRISASTLSVNGSARTAKRSAISYVRKWYHRRIVQSLTNPQANNIVVVNNNKNNNKNKINPSIMSTSHSRFFDQECRKLQDVLSSIQTID